MKKIDIVIAILSVERIFTFYGKELNEISKMEFFEIIYFDCTEAVKVIIGEDFFGEYYDENVLSFIEGWEDEIEFRLKMLEWDSTLQEEISSEQKELVLEILLKIKADLQLNLSILNDNGVYFWWLDKEDLLNEILKKLS